MVLLFCRVDLVVEADAIIYLINTQERNDLEKLGVRIQTPEHVLALVGCDFR
jgi:UDP-3-O-[3-hydroxymyristoyl] N-acetylglucosamine deacetylase/3-hydroxyacyl-[acyl-carrier-protein] dehydratase